MRKLKDELVALIANLPYSLGSPSVGMRPQTNSGDGITVNVQAQTVNRYMGFRKYTTLFQVALFGEANDALSIKYETLRYNLHRATIDGVLYFVNEAQQAYDERDDMVRVIEVEAVYIDTDPITKATNVDTVPPFPTYPMSLAGNPWYSYPENNTSGYGSWLSPTVPSRSVAFRDMKTNLGIYSDDLAELEFVGIKYKDGNGLGDWKDIQMPTMTAQDVSGRTYYYDGASFGSATIKYGINPIASSGVDFTMDFASWPSSYFEGGSLNGSITELEVQFYITTNEGVRVFHTLRGPTYN